MLSILVSTKAKVNRFCSVLTMSYFQRPELLRPSYFILHRPAILGQQSPMLLKSNDAAGQSASPTCATHPGDFFFRKGWSRPKAPVEAAARVTLLSLSLADLICLFSSGARDLDP